MHEDLPPIFINGFFRKFYVIVMKKELVDFAGGFY